MDEDFVAEIKRLYESNKALAKKQINEALSSLTKKIEQKKEELYKEVL
ncbi:MAG: hypothetical protein ACUVQ5_03575 [Candidatus Methanomethylicaceae archaeon]